ncbi:hypothetical protein [Runella sp. SP2]|uniref:hypothetical protein n=1 Tax=Runella sp. SP2 TaxID=2268026 RepID=UPI000F084592|nr:hypothetical protein [Runella sp. SP2]AYQ33378.1 hypothetical protein DTQ70_14970 [Runella sp. SP2]
MKTFIKSIACALALTSTVAFAHPTKEEKTTTRPEAAFESSAYVTNDAKIKVAIRKNAPAKVFLTLKDANGDVLFKQTVAKNEMNYSAKFNINELSDGVYNLEIESGESRVVKQLNVVSKKIEIERKVTVQ